MVRKRLVPQPYVPAKQVCPWDIMSLICLSPSQAVPVHCHPGLLPQKRFIRIAPTTPNPPQSPQQSQEMNSIPSSVTPSCLSPHGFSSPQPCSQVTCDEKSPVTQSGSLAPGLLNLVPWAPTHLPLPQPLFGPLDWRGEAEDPFNSDFSSGVRWEPPPDELHSPERPRTS